MSFDPNTNIAVCNTCGAEYLLEAFAGARERGSLSCRGCSAVLHTWDESGYWTIAKKLKAGNLPKNSK